MGGWRGPARAGRLPVAAMPCPRWAPFKKKKICIKMNQSCWNLWEVPGRPGSCESPTGAGTESDVPLALAEWGDVGVHCTPARAQHLEPLCEPRLLFRGKGGIHRNNGATEHSKRRAKHKQKKNCKRRTAHTTSCVPKS